ncbi:MAG: TMEM165/GDT1 family protein [Candidatus Thorarchaeota archaeon]|nr:MAG: TMEM165/GDT1 family protein [Candidatus Thorarchaeota archaeon]
MILDVFASSALLMFLAELGDKTMLATVCFSAQCRRPLLVMTAAMLALITSTVFAVFVGFVLNTTLPLDIIRIVSGLLFIIIGIWVMAQRDDVETDPETDTTSALSVFSVVLLAEMGDKTQLTAVTIAASSGLPIIVLLGSTLGFLLVTAIGAYFGDRAAGSASLLTVRRVTGILFLVFGFLVLAGLF